MKSQSVRVVLASAVVASALPIVLFTHESSHKALLHLPDEPLNALAAIGLVGYLSRELFGFTRELVRESFKVLTDRK